MNSLPYQVGLCESASSEVLTMLNVLIEYCEIVEETFKGNCTWSRDVHVVRAWSITK